MAKFCKECGALMADDEKFCPECGSNKGSKIPSNTNERRGARKGKIISFGVAVVFIVLGLIYFTLLRLRYAYLVEDH